MPSGERQLGAAETIGIAGSLSLFSGWRLYLCVLAAGIAMRLGWLDMPVHLVSLRVFANGWVLAAAGIGFVAEFFADKIAYVDSAWDALHTVIRPVGGALLALAVIDPSNTTLQVVVLLLGGSAALAAHGAKAGGRAMINASPEPVSNIIASTAEDGVTAGGLYVALAHPALALAVMLAMLAFTCWLAWWSWSKIAPLWRRLRGG